VSRNIDGCVDGWILRPALQAPSSFESLAALSLRGVVQLDALQSFLPQAYVAPTNSCGNCNSSAITLRELATHNSGLQENPKNLTWSQNNPQGHATYSRTDLYQSFTAG
jgi:hypothetical protein